MMFYWYDDNTKEIKNNTLNYKLSFKLTMMTRLWKVWQWASKQAILPLSLPLNADNNVIPETQDQRLEKLDKKQQQENWNNAIKNHNVIKYMHFANLATDQSNKIHNTTFWCYFDPHGNTTRMSNYQQKSNTKKRTTSVTITPAKASLRKINWMIAHRYREWARLKNLERLS